VSLRISFATIVVGIMCAPLVFAIAPVKHPSYCPLPENVTFDRTEHPELIGLYTGEWVPTAPESIFYVRKFCILVTSIRGNEVRGIYSWGKGGWDGQSGWREFQTTSSSLISTFEFSTSVLGNWQGPTRLTIKVEFHKKGKATATYTKIGKGVLGLRTQNELQSRLVKIE